MPRDRASHTTLAGSFDGGDPDSPFVVEGSYLDRSYYADELRRGGLDITFVSEHRPLQAYADAWPTLAS